MPVYPGSIPGNAVGQADGRLTLTSGVPVTTSNVTAASTIYYTPYLGDQVSVFDGSVWTQRTFTELSLAITATSGNMYDVWLYDNNGTLTLETLAWTNTTTRATAIVRQNGIWSKTGALTRRLLGSFYATGTNQTSDAEGSSGVATFRCLSNAYNRVPRRMLAGESTGSWAYNTATWRATNNSALARLNIVNCLDEDSVHADAQVFMHGSTALNNFVGIGVDSTSSPYASILGRVPANNTYTEGKCSIDCNPGVGFHYLQQLEKAEGSTSTWYGMGNGSYITGWVMA